MSAVPSVHNLVNDESSTPLRVVKPYTDVSPPFICRWTGPGSNQCSQLIDFSNVAEHLAEAHGIKNTPWDVLLHCGWQDCGKKVIRKNLLRHTREVHLRPSRRSNRAVTNWRERRREAHGDFLEIGREMSELGIVWKGEAKEHKDADPYSDLVHVESSESESVAKRDKVGTSPDEADQQNDAFDSSNDEPLRDVFPGDAFWETGVSDRCPPVKPQKAGLLSKLSTLLWRPKSRQCAQERVRASPEIISTARPTVRLSVLPWKEDRRDRLRSRADRHRPETSTANEGEHSSQHSNRQPAGHQSNVDTSLYRHGTATSATDTRDGQTSDGEHDRGCFTCRSKPSQSSDTGDR